MLGEPGVSGVSAGSGVSGGSGGSGVSGGSRALTHTRRCDPNCILLERNNPHDWQVAITLKIWSFPWLVFKNFYPGVFLKIFHPRGAATRFLFLLA